MPTPISEAALKATPALQSFVYAVNLATDGSPTGNPALNLAATFAPGEFGFHDNNFGGSSTFGFDTEGDLGGMVDFYFLKLSNFAAFELVELGTIRMLSDGTLTFGAFDDDPSLNPDDPAVVPLPMTIWLLGAGLVGIAGTQLRHKG